MKVSDARHCSSWRMLFVTGDEHRGGLLASHALARRSTSPVDLENVFPQDKCFAGGLLVRDFDESSLFGAGKKRQPPQEMRLIVFSAFAVAAAAAPTLMSDFSRACVKTRNFSDFGCDFALPEVLRGQYRAFWWVPSSLIRNDTRFDTVSARSGREDGLHSPHESRPRHLLRSDPYAEPPL